MTTTKTTQTKVVVMDSVESTAYRTDPAARAAIDARQQEWADAAGTRVELETSGGRVVATFSPAR